MALDLDLPSTEEYIANDSTFLTDQEGCYHMAIIHTEENAKRGDEMVKGYMYELAVQAPKELAGMTFKAYFQNGDPTHKDGGDFCRKKQSAGLIAANVITPSDLGKKGVSIDVEKALNHQVMVKLALGKVSTKTNRRYLDVHYSDIFHVDDPRAKSYPKDTEALAIIPKEFRRDEAFFAPLVAKPETKKTQRVEEKDFEGL